MATLTAEVPDVRGTTLAALDPDAMSAAIGRVLPGVPQVPVASFGSSI